MRNIRSCLLFAFWMIFTFGSCTENPLRSSETSGTTVSSAGAVSSSTASNIASPSSVGSGVSSGQSGSSSSESAYRVLIFGDTRGTGFTGNEAHIALLRAMQDISADKVLHLGDLTYQGGTAEYWSNYHAVAGFFWSNRVSNFLSVIGNHELSPDTAAGLSNFHRNFPANGGSNWLSVTVGPAEFYLLYAPSESLSSWGDTLSNGGPQWQWLSNALENSSAAKWKVALLHSPVMGSGPHTSGVAPFIADPLAPLLEKYGVQLVFSGHNHGYERWVSNGIRYVTSGGGGAPLHVFNPSLDISGGAHRETVNSTYEFCVLEFNSSTLALSVRQTNGTEIDRLALTNQ